MVNQRVSELCETPRRNDAFGWMTLADDIARLTNFHTRQAHSFMGAICHLGEQAEGQTSRDMSPEREPEHLGELFYDLSLGYCERTEDEARSNRENADGDFRSARNEGKRDEEKRKKESRREKRSA